MSINHFMNKIKDRIGVDNTTLLCFLVIILVGLSSFGLGRLSVTNSAYITDNSELEDNNIIIKDKIGDISQINSDINNEDINKERRYVASKNGKLYYTSSCSGAKRISPKNEVWFSSSIDAEKAGYTLSSSCK